MPFPFRLLCFSCHFHCFPLYLHIDSIVYLYLAVPEKTVSTRCIEGGHPMSVLLQTLYEETKKTFGLTVLAGASGLENPVSWIYIAESLAGPGYLNGGELIITTGILCQEDPDWLYHLVEGLLAEHSSGLILNTGKYIKPAHITQKLLDLCNRTEFPLLTMPWETAITAVTHDYYSRLFLDSQHTEKVDQALLDLIHNRQDSAVLLSQLEDNGFPVYQPYGLLYIHAPQSAATALSGPFTRETAVSRSIRRQLRHLSVHGHLCCTDTFCLLLLPQQELYRMTSIAHSLGDFLSETSFYDTTDAAAHKDVSSADTSITVGIGSTAATLANLPRAFFHARCSALIASSRKQRVLSFDELGIYQILLSVTDRGILYDYVRRRLQTVLDYDKHTGSNCTDILYHYLLTDCSIQQVADALYCHRNTVNKKVRLLKDELHYDLENPVNRFELLLAFYIRDYLALSL